MVEVRDDGDVFVLDPHTGVLGPATPPAYGPADEVDHVTFQTSCRARRAALLREMADRLRSATTADEPDLRSVLGIPLEPPPLGAVSYRFGGPPIPVFELTLPEGVLERSDVEQVFGEGEWVPLMPYGDHKLAFYVPADRTPWKVALFASFHVQPEASTPVKSLLLRLDPAH